MKKISTFAAMKNKRKITKNNFLIGFMIATAILALIRLIFPSIAGKTYSLKEEIPTKYINKTLSSSSIFQEESNSIKINRQAYLPPLSYTNFYNRDGKERISRINSVADYDVSFPDSQHVQVAAALKYAVPAVENRIDAEKRIKELVYIGSNPFYEVKKLSNSVPYLVPRASILLQDIGRNFFDSLQVKNIPLNKLLVTSVLRTKEDIKNLQKHNGNATEKSCHLYGTTFDIAYNKYRAITRPVRDDTLKWVLSEVLNDMRKQGRCYIKYEKRQGCFHITIR
ncbi:hypothetical protein HMPREF0653_00090 [Prevotella disiens JCM 6334 = ATCC 29426]|uniref:Uncharacterized protein n=3 Tax=Prevotella disiens TaxID=28130 RepID=A0A379DY45_9BACT|nr:hypothetical protein HMPREF0653_00090 [Prevotella disiens JCM 6334 = ATCC 29426]SUB85408.1 Uncharacterised protein [Prevotella disiens]